MVIPIFEYHNILFSYIYENTKIDFMKERNKIADQIVAEHIHNCLEGDLQGKGSIESLTSLQNNIEEKMASIISKKSIYYWVHLYRRIGVESSFHGESLQTLLYYRTILEIAFKKYGATVIGDELLIVKDNNKDVRIDEIANGLYKKACEQYGLPTNPNVDIGICLKNFDEDSLLEIYTLERLAFEYWYTTACIRRLHKGGTLVYNFAFPDNPPYSVFAKPELEKLMKSYDKRFEKYEEVITSNGIISSEKQSSHEYMVYPQYNIHRYSFEDYPQYKIFNLPISDDVGFQKFIPNFVWTDFDFEYYYDVHSHLSEVFFEKYNYSFESFVCTMYLILYANWSNANGDAVKACAALKRAYQHWESIDAFKATIVSIYNRIKDNIGFHLDISELNVIFNDLMLPESREKIWLSSCGPQYLIFEADNKIVVDYNVVANILFQRMHFLQTDDDKKGHLFEDILIDRLKDKEYRLWEYQKELTHDDGSSKEIDLSFILGNYLFIGELKCNTMSLAYINGDLKSLEHRKDKMLKAIKQVDELAIWLKKHPTGTNYQIPEQICGIVPFVVSPFTEYIWDNTEELWLTSQIPRVCTPKECELLYDQSILSEIVTKPFVINLDE